MQESAALLAADEAVGNTEDVSIGHDHNAKGWVMLENE